MRRFIVTLALVGMTVWAVQVSQNAWAFPEDAVANKAACATCHTNPAGGPALTEVGADYGAETKVPTDVAGATYIGSKKCTMCHRAQAASWAKTSHAKAFAGLQAADEKTVTEMADKLGVKVEGKAAESNACVGCHVTGFGLPGGYAKGAEGADLLSNVTCESCHGPGSLHMKAAKTKKKATINSAVSEKMCMQCHVEAISPEWDFAKYKEKGVHKVAKAGE